MRVPRLQAAAERALPKVESACVGADGTAQVPGAPDLFHEPAPVRLALTGAPLVQALYSGDRGVGDLYRLRPAEEVYRDISSREYPREALAAVLAEQNRGAGPAVQANIEALRDAGTAAVVTGQQVGVLGGPALTLYKALGAIQHAEALSQQKIKSVPVFWLASYDHDFGEVAAARVLGRSGAPQNLPELTPLRPGAPVGEQKLGAEVEHLLSELEGSLADGPHKAEAMRLLREFYRPEATFAEAFAGLLGHLTDRHGLIILDPSQPSFARLTRPILERELFGETSSAEAIRAANDRVRALGHQPTVRERGDKLNVFFLDDNGRRVNLERQADGSFATDGAPGRLEAEEVRRLLETSPERFTPSALLRPVVEDSVLPTMAYVGGPSELAYYAQIGGAYDWAKVPYPSVVSRPSFSIVNAPAHQRLAALPGRSLEELLGDKRTRVELGRAALPDGVRSSYERLGRLTNDAHELARVASSLGDRREFAALRERVCELRDAVQSALADGTAATAESGLQRAQSGLTHAAELCDAGFAKTLGEIDRAAGTQGVTPTSHHLSKIATTLGALQRQLDKVGMQEQQELTSALRRAAPDGKPQERQMTVAQLVADYGPEVVDVLLPLSKPRGPDTP